MLLYLTVIACIFAATTVVVIFLLNRAPQLKVEEDATEEVVRACQSRTGRLTRAWPQRQEQASGKSVHISGPAALPRPMKQFGPKAG
ncbi:hypothetical protein Poly41_66990 [Novipirellula artificiosorum]|uniref:Uncharacterized protein n=1 Tax=Novipirellula artificiosorum TaxID=2528016 RepID=A0A5C6D054_9BACT|nr:hypothetical protein Poly41_66990 [Novipirellula artificiosorum]